MKMIYWWIWVHPIIKKLELQSFFSGNLSQIPVFALPAQPKGSRVLGGAAYSQGPLPKEAGKHRLMSRVRGKVPLHFSCKIEVVKDAVTGQLKPGSVVGAWDRTSPY
jgi:hypothetical protein